jgi:hypothetical protein
VAERSRLAPQCGKKVVVMDHHPHNHDEPSISRQKALSDGAAWSIGWFALFVVAGVLFAFGMKFLVGTEEHHETAGVVLWIVALIMWIGLLIAIHRRKP